MKRKVLLLLARALERVSWYSGEASDWCRAQARPAFQRRAWRTWLSECEDRSRLPKASTWELPLSKGGEK